MYQELFSIQEEVFRTTASQKRLEIIQLLHNRELTVSKVTDMLGISQTNVPAPKSLFLISIPAPNLSFPATKPPGLLGIPTGMPQKPNTLSLKTY